jgi:hypothetical protein
MLPNFAIFSNTATHIYVVGGTKKGRFFPFCKLGTVFQVKVKVIYLIFVPYTDDIFLIQEFKGFPSFTR